MEFSRTTTGFFKKGRSFDGLDSLVIKFQWGDYRREERERNNKESVWFLVRGSDGLFGGSGTLEGDFLNGLYGDMDFSMDCKFRWVYGRIMDS